MKDLIIASQNIKLKNTQFIIDLKQKWKLTPILFKENLTT